MSFTTEEVNHFEAMVDDLSHDEKLHILQKELEYVKRKLISFHVISKYQHCDSYIDLFHEEELKYKEMYRGIQLSLQNLLDDIECGDENGIHEELAR